jgi:SAM-dependent methyltransferase
VAELPLKTDRERWNQAQAWELDCWRQQEERRRRSGWVRRVFQSLTESRPPADEGDDWNRWWAERFDGYKLIPDRLDNVVELGCGPYTNIRLILPGRQVRHCFCSDPLAREYVRFEGRWLAEAWRKGLVMIDDHPLEECPFASDYFDLVVMINVLDHVRDSIECLQEASRISRFGGLIIVGQDLTSTEDAARFADDIGHPIRMDQASLDAQLMPRFEPLLHRVLPREQGRNPEAHYGTYLFIGAREPGRQDDL